MARPEKRAVNRSSFTDIHLRLLKARNAVLRKRKQQSDTAAAIPEKINRNAVIMYMAERLSISVYQNLPPEKQQQTTPGKLCAVAGDLLKAGEEPETVAEKLNEMFS